MCGIAGWYCFGDARPSLDEVKKMWDANEWRGKDAAGLAYVKQTGESIYFKQPGKLPDVKVMVAEETWASLIKSHVGILHTRQATSGDPKDNENNHPIIAANWLITHNGVISNDDALWKKLGGKIKRPGEVDSSAINLVLGDKEESWTARIGRLGLLSGSATVAGWHYASPKEVLVARVSSSPLYLKLDTSRRMVLWSSVRFGLEGESKFLGLKVEGAIIDLPEKTAMVFSPSAVRRYSIPNTPFRAGYHRSSARSFPARGVVVKDKDASYRHEGAWSFRVSSDSSKWEGKPFPVFQSLSGENQALVTPFDVKVDRDFPTPYGLWMIKAGEISSAKFAPHRRIRKWWNEKIEDTVGNIVLPAVEEVKVHLDNSRPLEVIKWFKGAVQHMYYMCPWCGIFATIGKWYQWQFQCTWCGIKSSIENYAEVK